MTRAVLDTNVVISGLFWSGPPSRIMGKALKSKFILVSSRAIIDEIEEILARKFKLSAKDISEFHEIFVSRFEIIEVKIRIPSAVPRDPSDNKIIECAQAGNADYIVTGDDDLLSLKKYADILIVSPNDFVKLI